MMVSAGTELVVTRLANAFKRLWVCTDVDVRLHASGRQLDEYSCGAFALSALSALCSGKAGLRYKGATRIQASRVLSAIAGASEAELATALELASETEGTKYNKPLLCCLAPNGVQTASDSTSPADDPVLLTNGPLAARSVKRERAEEGGATSHARHLPCAQAGRKVKQEPFCSTASGPSATPLADSQHALAKTDPHGVQATDDSACRTVELERGTAVKRTRALPACAHAAHRRLQKQVDQHNKRNLKSHNKHHLAVVRWGDA